MRRILILLVLISVVVPAAAAVRGTIMTIAGAPVPGARIEAFSVESSSVRDERLLSANPIRPPLTSTVSDASGNFSLDAKTAVVDLVVTASGYEPFGATVAADDDVGAVPLRAARPVSGSVNGSGKPLEGARVVFTAGPAEVVAITDAEGRYSVPDPAVWAQSVSIHHSDYASLLESLSGGRKSSLKYDLVPGVNVAGRVVGEDNTPVAGANVSIGPRRAVTAEDGTFRIAHVPDRRPAIRVTAGDRFGIDSTTSRSVLVKLHSGSTLQGVVRDARTQKPLAGARISTGQFNQTESVISDAKGNFVLRNTAAGRRRLWVSYPNYVLPPAEIDIRPGQVTSKDLVMTQTGTIQGTVLDESKKVVPAVRIAFVPTEDSAEILRGMVMNLANQLPAYSAPDGRFVLRHVPPEQSVEVTARRRGAPAGSVGPLKLASGELKKGVSIILPYGITVSGKVVDRHGQPLAAVTVIPMETEGGGPGGMRRVVMAGARSADRDLNIETKNDGTFSLQLKQGKYDLMFRRDGFAPKRVRSYDVTNQPEPLEVVMEPGVEIRGRVARRDGAAVPEVIINPMTADYQGEQIRTGSDGSFTISNLTPGSYMIMAVKPDEFIREMRNVEAPADNVLIEIPATGRIEGRVVEKGSGQPVKQFSAGLATNTGGRGFMIRMAPMMKSFTSEDGSFVLENVPAGKTDLLVSAAGYVEAKMPNLMIEEGKAVKDIEIELEAGVRVFGKVTGPDGAPLVDASVRTEEQTGGPMPPGFGPDRANTDGSGEYVIEGAEPGEKTLVFSKEGYVAERRTVKLAGREMRLDVRLSRGKDIAGTVVDEQGMPVSNANVIARSGVQDAGFRATRTDPNGAFRLEGLTPGRYTFSASKSGYVTGDAKDIDLDAAAAAGIRITLTGGGTIFGHITGLTEAELAAANVMATGSGRSSQGMVEPNGNYRIEGVPTGTVRVSATTGRFPSQRSTQPKVVEVTVGAEIPVDLEFRNDVVVRGRVTRQGRPIDNAMVIFDPREASAQTRASTRTDAAGNYEVPGLEPGLYAVAVVDLQRGTSFDTTYRVAGSDTFDIEVRGAQVRGRVIDAETGEPVADAAVTLQKAEARGGFSGPLGVSSDAAGNFVFDTVSPGAYRARAQKERYGQAVIELAISESDASDLVLRLSRNDGIRVRVVDGRDGRPLRSFVWVRDQQGRTVYEGQPSPNADGVVVVPLSGGAYRVMVGSMGYASRAVNVVVPSGELRIALSPGGAIAVQSKQGVRQMARLMTPNGDLYQRGPWSPAELALDPGTTTLENLAPGSYVLQLLNERGAVKNSYSITVVEGQIARLEI